MQQLQQLRVHRSSTQTVTAFRHLGAAIAATSDRNRSPRWSLLAYQGAQNTLRQTESHTLPCGHASLNRDPEDACMRGTLGDLGIEVRLRVACLDRLACTIQPLSMD